MAPPARRARSARLAAALAAAWLAAPAVAAGPRLAIAPVRGDPGGALRLQLGVALCAEWPCLPGAGGLDGPRPDLARARRLGATAALLGSVWRERGGPVLSLALFTEGKRPARSWVFPLDPRGRLPAEALRRLEEEMGEALGVRRGGAREGPTAPAFSAPSPRPSPPVGEREDGSPSAPSSPRPAPRGEGQGEGPRAAGATPSSSPTPSPAPSPSPSPSRPATPTSTSTSTSIPPPTPTRATLTLEAGLDPAHLSLRFPSGGTSPVGYSVTLPTPPLLRLAWHPSPRLPGLQGEAAWLGGLAFPSGDRTHRATYLRWRAGLAWPWPVARWLTVTPDLAWEQQSLVVGRAGGIKVPGLPDTRLSGASAGLALQAALGGSGLSLLAAGRGAWWFSARELAGGASFYPGGAAWGLEAEAGAALRLVGPLSLRATGTWSRTTWALDADPSGAFAVRSAEWVRLGGRLTMRADW